MKKFIVFCAMFTLMGFGFAQSDSEQSVATTNSVPPTAEYNIGGSVWDDIFFPQASNLGAISIWLRADGSYNESTQTWSFPGGGSGNDIIISDVSKASFFDLGKGDDFFLGTTGYVWNNAYGEIQGGVGDDLVYVPSGQSLTIVDGEEGDDTIVWGSNSVSYGYHTLGGSGDDAYYWHEGDSPLDLLEEGGTSDTLYIVLSNALSSNWSWGYRATDPAPNPNGSSPTDSYRLQGGFGGGVNLTILEQRTDTENITTPRFIENLVFVSGSATTSNNNGDNDTIAVTGEVAVFGGAGNDTMTGDASDNIIEGEAGDDFIDGGDGDDLIYGDYDGSQKGNDTIYGGNGNDIILSMNGDDVVYGGAGDDRIHTANQRDIVYSGTGQDLIYAGSDDDQIFLDGVGEKFVFGGNGNDIYRFSEGAYGEVYDSSGGSDALYITANGLVTLTPRSPDLIISLPGGDDITVRGFYEGAAMSADHGIELIRINGRNVTAPQLTAESSAMPYLLGGDTVDPPVVMVP